MKGNQTLINKEVINIRDGSRLGCVEDVIVDCSCGSVYQLVVMAMKGVFSIFCKRDKRFISWCSVVKIGDDIILVDMDGFELRKGK